MMIENLMLRPNIIIFGAFNPIAIDKEIRIQLLETKSLSLLNQNLFMQDLISTKKMGLLLYMSLLVIVMVYFL
jgi:hypothetical protein